MDLETLSDWIKKYAWQLAFAGMLLIYFNNLRLDVMEVDAAQYASIAREMAENQSYLQVYHRGDDYLDKPPLLFWITSVSMQLLGVNNVAFKLPIVLIILLGLWGTYRFTKDWYGEKTAKLAALMLGYTQALFLITNDIRTDGMLMSWTILACWQLSSFIRTNSFKHLIWGSICVGLAMLTKGPLGMVIPATAFFSEFAIKRQWKNIVRWEWLIGLLVILIVLAPMCWGLYQQFDLHPEKEVYGLKGPSGIKFFFWTQSFGRITGDIYWSNDAPFYYFFLTILWDFTPWLIVLFPALFVAIRSLIVSKFNAEPNREYISLGGFVWVLTFLSLSNYKLPHYIFPLFPFAAILSARYLVEAKDDLQKKLARWQFLLLHIFFIAIGTYFYFCFSPPPFLDAVVMLGGMALYWTVYRYASNDFNRLVFTTVVAGFCLNLVISFHFYPNILPYQSSAMVGRKVKEAGKEWDEFVAYRTQAHSLDFYSQRTNYYRFAHSVVEVKKGTWVYTDQEGKDELNKLDSEAFRVLEVYDYYRVSNVSISFLWRKERPNVLKKRYLLERK
ncbi:MAG: glycosyltransferase family 39 protein [Bacteroidota bacterium]